MTTHFCVLNLTSSATKSSKRLSVDQLSLVGTILPIEQLDQIPTHREALILYIVGHAVPDALLLPDGEALSENEIVATVKAQRGNNPTLIIWDFCYAKSFAKTRKPGWAGKPYVHVFSCNWYEQSWHTSSEDPTKRQTLFSIALVDALEGGIASWDDLKRKLKARLGRVQRPSVLFSARVAETTKSQLTPADFGLPVPPSQPRASIPALPRTKKTLMTRHKKALTAAPSKGRHKKRPRDRQTTQVQFGA